MPVFRLIPSPSVALELILLFMPITFSFPLAAIPLSFSEMFGGQAIPWLPADEARSAFSTELCNSCPLTLQSQFWDSVISFVNPYVPGRFLVDKSLSVY